MNEPLVMPDGKFAPTVLTADEVIVLLRLGGKNPRQTLDYYRRVGRLTGMKIGREFRYTTAHVRRFLESE